MRRSLFFAVVLLAVLGDTASSSGWQVPAAGGVVPAGNLAMEARLRAIYQATDWKADPNKPAERARYYSRLLSTQQLTSAQQQQVLQELARERLRAGDARGALQALDSMGGRLTGSDEAAWHQLRAVAFLRLGEIANCAAMHGQHSCVFPLRAEGVHQLPEGARGAVQELQWVLEHQPDNALDKWLLNVAYMQLGQYPRSVPPVPAARKDVCCGGQRRRVPRCGFARRGRRDRACGRRHRRGLRWGRSA